MDEPLVAWPFWKFGFKRSDLDTKLHDQYNTTTSSIQDPDAFHHDVFEISHEASTVAEFHSLMAARKEHRLRELNKTLEAASFEIIANPALIGTEKWQFAVQLFRTRSFDSLVRYFASYLPENSLWPDMSSCGQTTVEVDHSYDMFFEKSACDQYDLDQAELPPSPRSMTTHSDSLSSSHHHHDQTQSNHFTLSRSMSFSDSEPDHIPLKDSCPSLHDDSASQTSASSISDASETHDLELLSDDISIIGHDDECMSVQPSSTEDEGSETPTPKPKAEAAGECASFFFRMRPSPLSSSRSLSCRDYSPSRSHPLSHTATAKKGTAGHITASISLTDHINIHEHARKHTLSPARLRRRDHSPTGRGRRRGPAGGVSSTGSSRVQKSSAESARPKPRGRRLEKC